MEVVKLVNGLVIAVAVVDGTIAATGVAESPGRVSELVAGAAVVVAVAAGNPRDPPRVGSVFAGAASVAVLVAVLAAGIENPENAGGADVAGAVAVAPNPVNPVVGAAVAKGLPNPRDNGAAAGAGAVAVVNGRAVAAEGAPNPPKLKPPDGVGATAAVGTAAAAGAPNANPELGEAVTLNAGGAAPATAGVD